MRRGLTLAGIGVAGLLALVWGLGGLDALGRMAAEAQRAMQAPLAGAVRAVKAGEPAAWAGLLAVCFGYGVVHAAGPQMRWLYDAVAPERRGQWREAAADLAEIADDLVGPNDIVMVKGSNGSKASLVAAALADLERRHGLNDAMGSV